MDKDAKTCDVKQSFSRCKQFTQPKLYPNHQRNYNCIELLSGVDNMSYNVLATTLCRFSINSTLLETHVPKSTCCYIVMLCFNFVHQ